MYYICKAYKTAEDSVKMCLEWAVLSVVNIPSAKSYKQKLPTYCELFWVRHLKKSKYIFEYK